MAKRRSTLRRCWWVSPLLLVLIGVVVYVAWFLPKPSSRLDIRFVDAPTGVRR